MKKMVISINENYEVRSAFKGNTDELMRCYRALARHIKEQAKNSAVLADAANYTPELAQKPVENRKENKK